MVPEQLSPPAVKRRQPARARVSGPDRGGRDAAGEPPGFHGVHDPAPGERVDHMGRVARHQDAVGIGLPDGRVHDDAAYGAARLLTARVAARDPVVEVLSGVATIRLQGHEAEAHVRHTPALGEDPCIPAWSYAGAELQIDGGGIEVYALEHVLRARLHVPGGDAGVEARPPADHRFDAVRSDHDPRPAGRLAPGAAQLDPPPTVGLARHAGRLR